MKWWQSLLSIFSGPEAEPIKLNAWSEQTLAGLLSQLAPGQRGWIAIDEARRLFSSMDEDTQALTEWDPEGLRRLGEFAAKSGHRSTPLREGDRVFFTRKAS
ncbi:MAG: hypothetical protein WCD69_12225 [Xanthobacteraceae bacterium]